MAKKNASTTVPPPDAEVPPTTPDAEPQAPAEKAAPDGVVVLTTTRAPRVAGERAMVEIVVPPGYVVLGKGLRADAGEKVTVPASAIEKLPQLVG